MYLASDYVEPAELTGYVRAALQDLNANTFTLSRYLPDSMVDDLEYRFYSGGEGLVEAATFRAYDAEAPIASRPGFARTQGELPPLSRKIRLGEYDRLRLRNARDRIVSSIQTDAERMTRSVAGRVELARGAALVDGKLTINENGVVASVDFGRKPEHTVTASTAWTDTSGSHPLLDMLAWQDVYVATNGEAPGSVLMSRRTFNLMLRNAEFRSLAIVNGFTPSLISADAVRSTLSAYGLPSVVINDQQINTSAGTTVRPIPVNKIVFLPANPADLGQTLWGTTAESLEPDFGIDAADGPCIVAGEYHTKDPVAVWTKAAAIALPIVAQPNLTLTATVSA